MSYYMEVSSCPTLPLSWVPNCPVPNCPVSKCPVPSCPVSSCPGFADMIISKCPSFTGTWADRLTRGKLYNFMACLYNLFSISMSDSYYSSGFLMIEIWNVRISYKLSGKRERKMVLHLENCCIMSIPYLVFGAERACGRASHLYCASYVISFLSWCTVTAFYICKPVELSVAGWLPI